MSALVCPSFSAESFNADINDCRDPTCLLLLQDEDFITALAVHDNDKSHFTITLMPLQYEFSSAAVAILRAPLLLRITLAQT